MSGSLSASGGSPTSISGEHDSSIASPNSNNGGSAHCAPSDTEGITMADVTLPLLGNQHQLSLTAPSLPQTDPAQTIASDTLETQLAILKTKGYRDGTGQVTLHINDAVTSIGAEHFEFAEREMPDGDTIYRMRLQSGTALDFFGTSLGVPNILLRWLRFEPGFEGDSVVLDAVWFDT